MSVSFLSHWGIIIRKETNHTRIHADAYMGGGMMHAVGAGHVHAVAAVDGGDNMMDYTAASPPPFFP